jgi:hypothetical protein
MPGKSSLKAREEGRAGTTAAASHVALPLFRIVFYSKYALWNCNCTWGLFQRKERA